MAALPKDLGQRVQK